MSYSQLGQDLDVIGFFANKREGYFVEVGAYDGILLSNTYLLETKLGWKGICLEPMPDAFAKCCENRKAICSNYAAYSKSGMELTFSLASFASGITQDINHHFEATKNSIKIIVKTKTLTDILDENNAPKYIEYMSIDTEGSELEILKGIDFNKYRFGFISIEHNYVVPRRQELRDFLENKGYKFLREKEWDDYYGIETSPQNYTLTNE